MNSEHGEVSITTDGNIIIAKLNGAFNEFGAKQYTEGVKAIVKELNGQHFSILVNNVDLLGGTPEAYQELENYNAWLLGQNLIAKAMVIESAIKTEIIDRLSPSRKQQNNRNFNNQEDALAWLKSLN